jgi:Matrixin
MPGRHRLGGTGTARRRVGRTAVLLALAALAVTVVTAPRNPARADHDGWHWAGSTFCIADRTGSDRWPITTAARRFDRGTTLTVHPGCTRPGQRIVVQTYHQPDQRCGLTTIWRDRAGRVVSAEVGLNTYYPTCLSSAVRRAHVISHELGHALGLAHTTREDSVMSTTTWSYDHIPYPTSFDLTRLSAG